MYSYWFVPLFVALSVSCGEHINCSCCSGTLTSACEAVHKNRLTSAITDSDDDLVAIHLDGNTSVINSTVTFVNKSSVSLIGIPNGSLICCSQDSVAGLVFDHVNHIEILNVTFFGCGATFRISSEEFAAGILITRSSITLLTNVVMAHGRGRGICILESRGTIAIENTNFTHNFKASKNGGGLYIKLNSSNIIRRAKSDPHTYVKITHCFFKNNIAEYQGSLDSNFNESGIGDGGGLNIFMMDTNNNDIQIQNCTFSGNSAIWGGGMSYIFLPKSINNFISICNCTFIQNFAKKGGGAINIAYFIFNANSNNTIHFINNVFLENCAWYGGGVHISSAQMNDRVSNYHTMQFRNCKWDHNSAKYASAIYLKVRITDTFNRDANLPTPFFERCEFIDSHSFSSSNRSATKPSKATFYSVGYRLFFKDKITFNNNMKTALYLVSSTVLVENNTEVIFDNNTGQYGGAVAMYGSSAFHLLGENIWFTFSNNIAEIQGGAVFQQVSPYLSDIGKRNCFVHLLFSVYKPIKFVFRNNHVQSAATKEEEMTLGKSVYLHSLKSCQKITNFSGNSNRVAFVFERSLSEFEISTDGRLKFKDYVPESCIQCIPGKDCNLPIEVVNDFNLTMKRLIRVKPNHQSIGLHPSSRQLLNHTRVIVLGTPGTTGSLIVSLVHTDDDRELKVRVSLRSCPPGYLYNYETKVCLCSTVNKNTAYFGVKECDNSIFQAILKRSVWIGYEGGNGCSAYGKEKHLYSSLCPRRYCTKNLRFQPILLPNTSSIQELDLLICGLTRTGVVCGKCRENHSAFYHSENLDCYSNKLCSWGWMFYFLSEILPITILLVLITLLNIQLTSGSIQGFILFAQMFETLLITAHEQIILEKTTYYILVVLRSIYRMVNLEFFTRVSFCIWKGASSLDVVIMKYTTITYSLLLVILVIIFMNKCGTSKYCIRISPIHGLSGFFVLCYAQITKVSLQILTPVTLYSEGQQQYRKVAFYDGSLNFLSGKHLFYAVPALAVLFSFVFLPPILLIVYPLCYRILAFLHLEESAVTKIVCKLAPIERLKPFFDSIQGCFKDKCRFFAGLYFLYRLTALISFAVMHTLSDFYIAIQIQFMIMFLLHFWAQPYKEKWHNYVDSGMFAALLFVNALTICIYHQIQLGYSSNRIFMHVVQIAIAYVPLLYFGTYCILKVFRRLSKNWFERRKSRINDLEISLSDNTFRINYEPLDI